MNSWEIFCEYRQMTVPIREKQKYKYEAFEKITKAIIVEYKNGIYPEYVKRMGDKINKRTRIFIYEYMIIYYVAKQLMNVPYEMKVAEDEMFDEWNGINLAQEYVIYLTIKLLEKTYLDSERTHMGTAKSENIQQALQEEITTKKTELNELEREIKAKKEECDGLSNQLEIELEEGRKANNKKIENEYKNLICKAYQRISTEITLEKQKAIQEEMARVKENALYERKKQDDDELIASMSRIRADRKEFVDNICKDIRKVSVSIKEQTDGMETQMNAIQDTVEKEIARCMKELFGRISEIYQTMSTERANDINKMVNMQREIEGADYDMLVSNFCALQESLYYNSDEKELGLHPTKINNYLRTFIRILSGFGYEIYVPSVGEEFDDNLYEMVDERECLTVEEPKIKVVDGVQPWWADESEESVIQWEEVDCIKEVVTYGFKKDGEIVKKPGVTITKKRVIAKDK